MSRVSSIDELGENDSSKRARNIDLARAQMQKNTEARKKRETSVDLDMDTGSGASRNFAHDQNQVQKDQETFHESYDSSGSVTGGYHAGSTINQSQGSNSDTDGGGGSGSGKGNPHRIADAVKLQSDEMKESNLKNKTIKLF